MAQFEHNGGAFPARRMRRMRRTPALRRLVAETVLTTDDLVQGDNSFFAATGITDGDLLRGVRYLEFGGAATESLVMRSRSGTIRKIDAMHPLAKLAEFSSIPFT